MRYQVAEAHRRIGSICVNLDNSIEHGRHIKKQFPIIDQLIADEPNNALPIGSVSGDCMTSSTKPKNPTLTDWRTINKRCTPSPSGSNCSQQIATHTSNEWTIYRNMYEQGLSDEAIELAVADGRRAVELDPKNARAHLKYATILYGQNYKDPLALEHAEAAVRLDPNNWQNHKKLSEI